MDNFSPTLLAISYHYAPVLEPRAIQVSRLLSHLNRPVLLVRGGAADQLESIYKSAQSSEGVRQIVVPFKPVSFGRLVARLARRNLIPLLGKAPDKYRPWIKNAVSATLDAIKLCQTPPRAMVTFGQAWSDLLVGLKLKKHLDIPWLVHFSDPWTDLGKIDLQHIENADPISRMVNRSFERNVVRQCDRLIFITQETADLVLQKYSTDYSEKVRILPHCSTPDPLPVPAGKPAQQAPKLVRYLGSMNFGVTFHRLYQGLHILFNKRPDLKNKLILEVIGNDWKYLQQEYASHELTNSVIRFLPPVDVVTSQKMMQEADALLAYYPKVILLSKLVDYVQTDKTLLGIGLDGPCKDLIEEAGGLTADYYSSEAIANMFEVFLDESNHTVLQDRAHVRERFLPVNVAAKFNRFLDELI